MITEPTFKIEVKGMRNFDTLEEVEAFKKEIGSRYRATQKCIFHEVYELKLPETTFYTVYYVED